MKTLFEIAAKNEILERVNGLTFSHQGLWGKMNVSQMMAHCSKALEVVIGKYSPPRIFIGKIVGWLFKSAYTNEKPFPKNVKTVKGFEMTTEKDFEIEKERLISLIEETYNMGENGCTKHPHPFFGKFTPDEWGKGMYKHLDHHLRQFDV